MMIPEFVQAASEVAQSPFVFAILFIMLLSFVIWFFLKNKQELLDIMKRSEERSYERENQLIDKLDNYNDSLKEVSNTMTYMKDSMVEIQENMSDIRRDFGTFQNSTTKELQKIWEVVRNEDQ